jgi:hypothetical protein
MIERLRDIVNRHQYLTTTTPISKTGRGGEAQRSVLDFLQVMAVCIMVAGVFVIVGIYVGP